MNDTKRALHTNTAMTHDHMFLSCLFLIFGSDSPVVHSLHRPEDKISQIINFLYFYGY